MAKGKKTGGRVKGIKNRATIEKEARHIELVEAAKADGITPLEVMLAAMRQAWDAQQIAEAQKYAVDAAPYLHPRLSAQTVDAKVEHGLAGLLQMLDGKTRGLPRPGQ